MKQQLSLGLLRISMGWIFLWAFFDKVFGLGYATTIEKSWLAGVSPTLGFLKFGTSGPFKPIFTGLAGNLIVDWLFMLGLLFIGLTLLFNKYVLWGAVAGIIMMVLMWLALLFPANNPLIDEHIVYALVLALLAIKSKKGELSYR